MNKTKIKSIGAGVFNAFWIGFIIAVASLLINVIYPYTEEVYGNTFVTRISTSVVILLVFVVYCLICFIVALTLWFSRSYGTNINLARVNAALALHGGAIAFIGIAMLVLITSLSSLY